MNQTICVCGAGTMGSGIAQVVAQAGFPTILFDVNEAMLTKAKASINQSLSFLQSKGKITIDESNAISQRIHFTTDVNTCKAAIVIEAVVEMMDVKVELFSRLMQINDEHTIYASNTSSLSITQLSAALGNTDRVAGLHFFNPAPVMKLVEVVEGKYTSPQVVDTLQSLCTSLGKTPVVCKDAPGFIVNRVARHYYLEAMKMVELGVAQHPLIDQVLENAGFKMGPFKLMDMIGLDINYSVSSIVYDALGKPERLQPSSIQKAKVDANELGRKTGKGFYEYVEKPAK